MEISGNFKIVISRCGKIIEMNTYYISIILSFFLSRINYIVNIDVSKKYIISEIFVIKTCSQSYSDVLFMAERVCSFV